MAVMRLICLTSQFGLVSIISAILAGRVAAVAPVDVLSTASSISVSQRERNGLRGNQEFSPRTADERWREEWRETGPG